MAIFVSVLVNVAVGYYVYKDTWIDQYILPLLHLDQPDFHPLAMAILKWTDFMPLELLVPLFVQPDHDLCKSWTLFGI